MVFNSFVFWIIFPCIFSIYWIIPVHFRNVRTLYLFIVSYLLYMNWKPAFAVALLGVTVVTYIGARLLEEHDNRRKIIVVFFAILGLLPLLIFKYYNFLNNSITIGLEYIGMQFSLPGLNWAIPIGISFFTFQAIGYLLDVYQKRISAEKNFFDYALFVSFFPQITSGPISTAKDLIPQIKEPHCFMYKQGVEGLRKLLWGMFLKCVVADRLGLYVDTVYANYEYFSGLNCLIASMFYTIQIYCDFAGYSLMAIGIAKTLGFDLVNNFNRPYFATSITEFWKRWHISLTRWLTTHVYINLGGNRCSTFRQYWNIMATFIVSGLWHGANWTFVVWGIIHGFLQIIEKALGLAPKGCYASRIEAWKFLKPIRIIITFMLVNFAWIFFRMPTVSDAWEFIERIFMDHTCASFMEKANNRDKMLSLLGVSIVLFMEISSEVFKNKLKNLNNQVLRWTIYIIIFVMILTIGVLDAGQFIYVSF